MHSLKHYPAARHHDSFFAESVDQDRFALSATLSLISVYGNFPMLFNTIMTFTPLSKKPFENIVRRLQAFSSFPTMFSILPDTTFNILVRFILSSTNAFELAPSRSLACVKGLSN